MTAAPGQTVGPFFHIGLPYPGGNDLVPPARAGALRLHGRVLDGDGVPVPDAMIELWQADPDGKVCRVPGSIRRDGWTFTGFGRVAIDLDGHYWFSTLESGAIQPGRPPFFALTVFARGLMHRLHTRAYLPLDDDASDPFLVRQGDRAATLVSRADERGYVFDIRLQGDGETVFLDHLVHGAETEET